MTSLRIRRLFALGGAGFVLAFAGAAAASALELPPVPPVPSVPLPTTSAPVPTVPVPTTPVPVPTVPVPVPTTPAPLPPPPSSPVPVPAVPSPVESTAPITSTVTGAVSGATGTPALSAGGNGGTAGTGITGTSSPSGSAGPASASTTPFAPAAGTPAGAPASGVALPTAGAGAKHVATLRARKTPGRPGTVSVRFALPTRSRVTVDVRGPLPSCNRTARFAVVGRRGPNTLMFNGRIGRRRLVEGSYLLALTPTGRRPAWVAVHVGPRGAQPLPRVIVGQALSQCSSITAARAGLALRLDVTPIGGTPSATSPAAAPTAKQPPAAPHETTRPEPVTQPKAIALPFEGVEEAISELPAGLGYLLLLLLAAAGLASLLCLVAYVVRYVRSPSPYRD
jgi:hypothetical protein